MAKSMYGHSNQKSAMAIVAIPVVLCLVMLKHRI